MKYVQYIFAILWAITSVLLFPDLKPSDNIWLWLLFASTGLYAVSGVAIILVEVHGYFSNKIHNRHD